MMKQTAAIILILSFIFVSSCTNENEVITVTVENLSVEIDEFPINNQLIGQIMASTNHGSLSFSIVSQTPDDAVTIDAASGELRVLNKDRYNYELVQEIVGTVEVSNEDVVEYVEITIHVNDVMRIYDGDLMIDTQTKLESVGQQYYDKINGSVWITGENVNSVNSLSSIKFIDGNLLILATNLENLDGLEKADIADGEVVQIAQNEKLKNLDGLSGISANLVNLEIENNPALQSISGLQHIKSVSDAITISDTDSLDNLNGLSGINSPVKMLTIRSNSALENIDGLQSFSEIERLYFSENKLVTSLSGFNGLKSLDYLWISQNDALTDLKGLVQLETCKELTISSNASLRNLDDLQKLMRVNDGSLRIIENSSLSDFCGLSLIASLSEVGFNIRDNYYNPTKEDINNGDCSITFEP